MIRQSAKINLTQALEMHEDILDDIMEAVASNLTHDLEALEEPTCPKVTLEEYLTPGATVDDNANFIRWEIHRLEVEQITEEPLKIIRRIQSRKYYESVEGQANVDRITDEDIVRAKEVPIESLLDEPLKKQGNRSWCPCPLHDEKTASFCVYPDDNRWSCFGENIHGDAIDLYMRMNNLDFLTAVKALSKM